MVDKVLKEVHKIDNKNVDAKKAIPHAQHQAMKNRTKKIFVGGVPTEMTEETLRDYFNQFGEVLNVEMRYSTVNFH